MTRVYLPSTASRLREVVRARSFGPLPIQAHTVTDAVRAELAGASEEEWEYAASSAASLASVALLGADAPARRVDVAVDVRRTGPAADRDDPTAVTVDEEPLFRDLSAVLVDVSDAEADVAAARDAAAARDPEADRLLGACLDHELGWWAVQEVPTLLDDLGEG